MGLRSHLLTGITLARDGVDLLRGHPGLLWFPATAGVAGVAFALLAFGGAVGVLPLAALANASGVALYGGLAVGYLGASFVIVLFTAGLMFATRAVMAGREPSVRGGLAAAAVGLPLVALAFVVTSTLNGVPKVALYEYATTGEPPQYFENVDFDAGGDGNAARTTPLGRFGGDRNGRI